MDDGSHKKCKLSRKKLRDKIREQGKQIRLLDEKVHSLVEQVSIVGRQSFCISADISSQFTENFWSKAPFQWKDGKVLNKDGVEAEPCSWDMPSQCEEILREMGAKRVLVGVVEKGKIEKQMYYTLEFREGGRIPPSWSKYCSYKFASKVELFMAVDKTIRSDVTKMTSTYKMFGSKRELLTGRLRLLMSYAYELAKFTWTRTFASDADGDRGMTARQLLDKQPSIVRQVGKRAARECQLFNRDLYSEEDARSAVGAVLKSFKDTDAFNAPLHNTSNPLFEQKMRKLFVTARVPPPFSRKRKVKPNSPSDDQQPTKRRQHEGGKLTRQAAKAKKNVSVKVKFRPAKKPKATVGVGVDKEVDAVQQRTSQNKHLPNEEPQLNQKGGKRLQQKQQMEKKRRQQKRKGAEVVQLQVDVDEQGVARGMERPHQLNKKDKADMNDGKEKRQVVEERTKKERKLPSGNQVENGISKRKRPAELAEEEEKQNKGEPGCEMLQQKECGTLEKHTTMKKWVKRDEIHKENKMKKKNVNRDSLPPTNEASNVNIGADDHSEGELDACLLATAAAFEK